MSTEISVDDELLARAREYSDRQDAAEIVREALTLFIQRGAARALAKMGGTQPQLRPIPRRRIL